uniref:FecR family protein n=1 Tax=Pedobacter schmidteae TaxID=2201271 RepID=UPI0013CEBFB9|nr:FecR family protein [Pedobacter schmidteae]
MNTQVLKLFTKYIDGQCTSTELEEVLAILKEGSYVSEWSKAISEDEEHIIKNGKVGNLTPQEIDDLYNGIESRLDRLSQTETLPHKKRISLWPRISIAAALILIVGGLFLFYSHSREVVKNNIMPGKNVAVLTFSNGKKISLSDEKTGIVIDASKLTYSDGTSIGQEGNHLTNELISANTPRGGTYQVILPDGTKVWLNAASTLKFPATFSGKTNREVELIGEAYFEVKKDKTRPFKVKTIQHEVEVLGTHFNINAYAEDGAVKTTLLEGSVKLVHQRKTAFLKPGQQGFVNNATADFKVVEADPVSISAWKNGEFIFNGTDLRSLMRQLSRWYDVEIVYEPGVKDDVFFGKIKRNTDLSKVLKILALGDVHFKIEDRKIIVMK